MDSDSRIREAVAGDVDALTELLNHWAPEVERSLSIGHEWRSVLEPADVMQVTYLEAFLQISRYDPDRAESFGAWLGRIAQNNLKDAIRGLQRQKRPQPADRVTMPAGADSVTDLLSQLGITTTTPSRHAVGHERAARLDAAIDSMPADYSKAIRLYDLQGMAIGEVARLMARSPGAVHMIRARAHDELRRILGPESAWFNSSA